MISALRLPGFLQQRLEAAASDWFHPLEGLSVNFMRPPGEAALVPAHSVSWRIFKNPVALFIGGVAAVLLELSEPAVRAGVWQHSQFNIDPLRRLRRTGLAAMVTVYGARSIAEPMIARVVQMHSAVGGISAEGVAYSANDARLLTWVHATAAHGFASAYSRYVERLDAPLLDQYFLESLPAAHLYGATLAPRSNREVHVLIDTMKTRLSASPIIARFLHIMHDTPALPKALQWLQPSLIRAATELIPPWIRERVGLDERYGPSRIDKLLVSMAGSAANRIVLEDSPAVQSCLRLGLSTNYLYR